MANIFNAITTGTGGVSTTGDSSGAFAFAKDGVTLATISTSGVVAGTAATPASAGGTGLTSPGTSGNVLTSNGTNWTSAAIPSSAPTTAQVQTAMAGSSSGDLGTWAMLQYTTVNAALTAGSNYAGSALRYTGAYGAQTASGSNWIAAGQGSAPSGTWKAMGSCAAGGATNYSITLFLRVA